MPLSDGLLTVHDISPEETRTHTAKRVRQSQKDRKRAVKEQSKQTNV